MINYRHYIPILKGKRGEFGALRHLTEEKKKLITPLIDVSRISSKSKEKTTIEAHLEKIAHYVRKDWGIMPILIDLTDIHPDMRTEAGEHPLKYIFTVLRAVGAHAMPVTGLDRDRAYNEAVLSIVKEDNRGACIRVLMEDTDNITDLNIGLVSLLNDLKLDRKRTHLLIDLKDIQQQDLSRLESRMDKIINGLHSVNDWHSFTLASSNFPESLASVKRNAIVEIDRRDYQLWRSFLKKHHNLKRLPSYGDYGVVHPVWVDIDLSIINPSAKIRYTLEDKWLVVKGHSLKTGAKYGQYHELAGRLIKESKYIGKSFSWGDDYITMCAGGAAKSGNLEMWIKVDTNHHITFVSDQISKIFVP